MQKNLSIRDSCESNRSGLRDSTELFLQNYRSHAISYYNCKKTIECNSKSTLTVSNFASSITEGCFKPSTECRSRKKSICKKHKKLSNDPNSSFLMEIIDQTDFFIQETRCDLMDIKVKPVRRHSFDCIFSFPFRKKQFTHRAINYLRNRINTEKFMLIKDICCHLEANPKTRDHMEDFINIEFSQDLGLNKVYVLCDGHNGSACAEIVSQKLPMVFAQKLNETRSYGSEDPFFAMTTSFSEVESYLRDNPDEIENSGSTANLLYLNLDNGKRFAYSGNIGDSRTVLVRENEAKRLSYDHKASDKEEQKRVKLEGGLIIRNRFYGTLAITRTFADFEYKDDVQGLSHEPYYSCTEILDTDKYIIMASDGVWDVITDTDLYSYITDYENRRGSSSITLAHFLVNRAMDLGSKDNISCIAITL